MFDNIGRKIKSLAKITCWIGIILSVLAGIIMMGAGEGILSGILTALLGSLLSWVGNFMMAGFGDLVENTAEIAAYIRENR